jgi:integrase
MSVRRVKRKDPKTGRVREVVMIDFVFRHADGRHERVRKVAPGNNLRAAEAYERQLIHALLNPPPPAPEPEKKEVAFSEFAEMFVQTYAVANNKFSEVESKKSILKHHLLPAFGNGPIDPGPKAIEDYKAKKLTAGLSRKTVNNHLGCLSKMINLAPEWEYIEEPTRVRRLKVEEQKFDFLTFEESKRLLDAVRDEGRIMILVALRTGLRFGEILALGWDDVDLIAGRLMVRRSWWRGKLGSPKNGREREVPLSSQVVEGLKAHRHLRGEYVFCREDGAIMSRTIAWRVLKRACKRAGLRQVGWHVLRHTFASHLVMRGVPLKTV